MANLKHEWMCSFRTVAYHHKRISGRLIRRIDNHVEAPRVDYDKLTGIRPAESSASVQARAEAARERQNLRFEGTSLHTNADMGPAKIRQFCALDETGRRLMRAAMQQLDLSARGYHRVLKLARTIADLAGSKGIEPQHLAEALQYRERRGE